ncbi:dienelactone hydrolase [Bradyrhizobium nanningense]|uniref:Dienelactone hydrolase n=1 Tax=Bradyrhizobium nanningense TaxID=1325118 RepID=A0A4Q0RUS8_9BRAD|nr:invasion associated locus B family protein [Bradyrhizobium nanningense]RXH22084.1 dienelactone hydrolase [Bradyrhizobium nanningense]RXH28272.1 dienelactone hydrolase [Bradyrhizobium nanningense]
MLKRLLVLLVWLGCLPPLLSPAAAEDVAASPKIQEELWALPFALPVLAFVVKPVGDGPFPLVIMNHGIALGLQERTMFPSIEYRAAAQWFAKRGYFVISPIRYGASSLDDKDQGLYGSVFAHVGSCDNPNFRGPGLAIATLNEWVIDYMRKKKIVQPGRVVVVGQSGGGWGSIALASLNPPSVQAIVTFAAGRGGRVDGKPNKNCAPDKLVAATGDFGRTARVPMLWIYTENDSYFGPELTRRMHDAFVAAGGNAEYRLLSAFGNDGHFMIDSPDALPIWSPIVGEFLEKHSIPGNAQQQAGSSSTEEIQVKPPRVSVPEKIQYSEWRKLCFESSDGTTICRTSSTGIDDLDQVVARVDLIQRADGPARLQLFVPQGADLQRGVTVSIDHGPSTNIPFNWCLTNICIAAAPVGASLIAELETGQTLNLSLTDMNSKPIALTLPLDRFAAVRKGGPAQTFDFGLDED